MNTYNIIDPEAVDPEDVEMLQDMIVAAVNEAIEAYRSAAGEAPAAAATSPISPIPTSEQISTYAPQ